jgi:hypothetical protein
VIAGYRLYAVVMTTYNTTADRVTVGDVLVDEDHESWTVKAVEVVDRFTEVQALRFTLVGEAGNTAYAVYNYDEAVTLDPLDYEGESFESALWNATAPTTDEYFDEDLFRGPR